MNPKRTNKFSLLCAGVLCASIGLQSCDTLPANSSPQQKAAFAIKTAETAIPHVVGPAVTAWLLLQKDPVKQQRDAGFVFSAATAINSAATGEVLTVKQLQDIIATFTGPDPRYIQLGVLLTSEYANLYPLFGIAGTSPVKFFTEVARSAENAALPFMPAKGVVALQELSKQIDVAVTVIIDFSRDYRRLQLRT